VFPYSARPGTPAADFDNQLDPETITRRAEELRNLSKAQRTLHLEQSIGNVDELLVEQDGRTGYTRGYLRTRLLDETHEPRKRAAIKILSVDKDKDILLARKVK
jgi:tRNA A37 methylthiotransferase MiaB